MAKRTDRDFKFEIDFYEGILKHSPDFIEALSALGDIYTKEGFYQKGLEVDQRLAGLRPDETVLYNLACSYSLLKNAPLSRRAMERAVAMGYNDFEALRKDADLAFLLTDVKFLKLLDSWEHGVSRRMPRRSRETV